jgi:5'-nucleotidase (lipoprotein e(P4) family)
MKKIAIILIPVMVIVIMAFSIKGSKTPQTTSVCDSLDMSLNEHTVMSVLWFQNSAEMRASYYQAYNFAKQTLDKKLKTLPTTGKKAVVLDIDETVLDNSPYQGQMIKSNFTFATKIWKEWTSLGIANPTPGVVDFLNYAKSNGVEVFFVSNRDDDEMSSTIKNMISKNIPFADTSHIFLRKKWKSDKTERYQKIAKNYKILLTIGDNLRDFQEMFSKGSATDRINKVDSLSAVFGENFIMLPNPMYGDWEKAIYSGKYPSEVAKNKLRKAAIKGYK